MSFMRTILRVFFVGFTSYAILSVIAYLIPFVSPSVRRSVFLAAIIVAAGHRRDDEKGGSKG